MVPERVLQAGGFVRAPHRLWARRRTPDPAAGRLRRGPAQATSLLTVPIGASPGVLHMKAVRQFLLAAAALFAISRGAAAQLKVVTSTTDLYDIAQAVGGDRIKASHIGEGYQDPH